MEPCPESLSVNAGLNYMEKDKTFSVDGILERTVLLFGGSGFHLVILGFRVIPMAEWLLAISFPFPIISAFSKSMMVVQVFLFCSAGILR